MATPIPKNRARFTTAEVLRATGGSLVQGDEGRAHEGLTTHSGEALRGGGFVALRGERFDGHAFVPQAVDAGASLVVVERGAAVALPSGSSGGARVDVVEVEDTLDAWGALARAHLARARATTGLRVLCITGSAGKTTTKELAAHLLATAGPVHATPGNLNNRIGAPAVALAIEAHHRFAVFEVGMSVPGEIAKLAAILEPDVALITIVGSAHAEGVGGPAGVAREKGALFDGLGARGVAIVNADDAAITAIASRLAAGGPRQTTFGRATAADYRLTGRAPRGAVSRVVVDRRGEPIAIDLPLHGEGAAVDAASALAAADALAGVPIPAAAVKGALAAASPLDGRGRIHRLADGAVVIDDTYNANPESMRVALDTLREIADAEGRRAVAVLGEMKELGEGARAAHDATGDHVAARRVGLVIGCGGLADAIVDRASRLGVAAHRAASAREAAAIAAREIGPGDVVLVKGSRGVAAEVVVDALRARAAGDGASAARAHATGGEP